MSGKETALPGLLEELRGYLERGLPQALVTTSYPFRQRGLPPDGPVVWLGVEKLTAAGSSFSPYLGEEKGTAPRFSAAVTGRELQLVLRLEILHRSDGNICHRLFGELCQRLLLDGERPRVQELSCGAVAFNREAGAFRLVCKGTLRGILSRSEEGLPLEEFRVVRKEGSSTEEKEVCV